MKYADALFPDRVTVAGLALQPLSVGHAILLQRLGSPFGSPHSSDHAGAGPGDIALSLVICSRPWRSAARLVQSWRGRVAIRAVHLRLLTFVSQIAALDGLSAYVLAAWRGPRVWLKPRSSKADASDALANILHILMAHIGQSQSEAMDTHLNQAIWDACMHLQSNGVLELMDAGDDDLLAAAAAMEKELANGPKN